MPGAIPDPLDAQPFRTVYAEELKWIDDRRKSLPDCEQWKADAESGRAALEQVETVANLEKTEPSDVEDLGLSANLCALAISGGGIRSATFSLGVLQGLAMTGLLPRFDYLSTVSGGGYIGAWFSAWVHREGFANVEEQLLPPRFQEKDKAKAEADPIRHLRLYSNYLAPRPGFFSFDGWVLIAIYLRNLLLNQSILLMAIIGLFGFARTIVEFFSIAHGMPQFDYFFIAPMIPLLVPLYGMWHYAPWKRLESNKHKPKEALTDFDLFHFWCVCVIPWLFAALLTSLLFSSPCAERWFSSADVWQSQQSETDGKADKSPSLDSPAEKENETSTLQGIQRIIRTEAAWGTLRAAAVIGLFHGIICLLTFKNALSAFAGGAITGAIGGALLFQAWATLFRLCGNPDDSFAIFAKYPVAVFATVGVPMTLTVFVLTNFLMIGLCGNRLLELEREWWSSLNARVMYLALGWAALIGTAIFGPYLLVQIWKLFFNPDGHSWSPILTGTLGTGWIGALLAGLRAASGSNTGTDRRSGWQEMLARIAPVLFLITLFLISALATTWLIFDIYSWIHPHGSAEWAFLNNISHDQLLTKLNFPKWVVHVCDLGPFPMGWLALAIGTLIFGAIAKLLGWLIGVNTFSMQNLYANRLTRCYLGASKSERKPDPVVNMDPDDDFEISRLYPGMAFQVQQLEEKERKAFDQKQERIKQDRLDKNLTEDAYKGPLYIVNGALNQKASSVHHRHDDLGTNASEIVDQKPQASRDAEKLQFLERQSESFVFTPLYCGSQTTKYCRTYEFADDLKLGSAIAVSGAAVSPNMGYHSSPAITALLTVFNIRLGAWFGNPKSKTRRKEANPAAGMLLLNEMAGKTDADSDYVYLSDGGHFENMGVYELIRRRCRFIVAVDAGADPKFHENVGRLVRQVRIDFGITLDIDMAPVTPGANGLSHSHVVVGRIHYGDVHKTKISAPNPDDPNFNYDDNQGIIVWIKNSLTGDESGDLINHAAMHPTFPYDTTLNQFFTEPQFESYRALGAHSIIQSLVVPLEQLFGVNWPPPAGSTTKPSRVPRKPVPKWKSTKHVFEKLYNYWMTAAPQFASPYIHENEKYAEIMKELRNNEKLTRLALELYGTPEELAAFGPPTPAQAVAERLMANEMFVLLENTYFALHLESRYLHPVNEGWLKVIQTWMTKKTLRDAWGPPDPEKREGMKVEYSHAFQRFMKRVMKNDWEGPLPTSQTSTSEGAT